MTPSSPRASCHPLPSMEVARRAGSPPRRIGRSPGATRRRMCLHGDAKEYPQSSPYLEEKHERLESRGAGFSADPTELPLPKPRPRKITSHDLASSSSHPVEAAPPHHEWTSKYGASISDGRRPRQPFPAATAREPSPSFPVWIFFQGRPFGKPSGGRCGPRRDRPASAMRDARSGSRVIGRDWTSTAPKESHFDTHAVEHLGHKDSRTGVTL